MEAELGSIPHLQDLAHLGSWRNINALAISGLRARIAAATGDAPTAIALWRRSVTVQDSGRYHEPPNWYPVRESLGAALLSSGDPRAAEAVFRQGLARNPGNPRALCGLAESLMEQGQASEAAEIRRRCVSQWKGTMADLQREGWWSE